MGHTLPTITQSFQRFRSNLSVFRRALRKSDQIAFDTLLNQANQHLPAASYAANLIPGISFLLALILEKHKQAERHESEFEQMRVDFRNELYKLQQEFAMQIGKLKTEIVLLKEQNDELNSK
jgi:trans-2-enoyl-CoA reductase